MLRLHYWPGACSLASHIALAEAALAEPSVAYALERVSLAERANWSERFLEINPKGYIPALELGDGRILTENTAIQLYLALHYPRAALLPQARDELATCLEWLAWQTNTAHIAFSQLWRPERFLDREEDREPLIADSRPRIRRHMQRIEDWLAGHDYAAGSSYSLADGMFLVFYRWGWRAGEPVSAATFPAWTAYIERLIRRPAVARDRRRRHDALRGVRGWTARLSTAIPS